jgi:sugar/nucleoside kinase (ribokinase family)
MAAARVDYRGIEAGGVGTVVSIVARGTRTMASDAGAPDWVRSVTAAVLPDDASALHVSGYPLLRSDDPSPVVDLCADARSRGLAVSVDLASAAMITAYGSADFASTVDRLRPNVVFANSDEWHAVRPHWNRTCTVVVKDGSRDVTVIRPDRDETRHRVEPADAVDPTGAGDALAGGYLVGGIEVGIAAAARCVATRGAQPA